jgi:hypothetical protein
VESLNLISTIKINGPSRVRAMPLAGGIKVVGNYFGLSEVRVPAEQT